MPLTLEGEVGGKGGGDMDTSLIGEVTLNTHSKRKSEMRNAENQSVILSTGFCSTVCVL